MVTRAKSFTRLKTSYLFEEVNKRKEALLKKEPGASLINLGIGDTTQPIPKKIVGAFCEKAEGLGTLEGYTGYGPARGILPLREKIAEVIYEGIISPDSLYISDGSKCDVARLQLLFSKESSIALQDPTYPAYLSASLISGKKEIVYMTCLPENDFFPDLNQVPKTDLIFFCSPNNPIGVTANRQQLESLVEFAKANRSIILFDRAYGSYIQDSNLPRSIYEIPGAKEVAIEMGSFSKMAGFTGVRLGFVVVPDELKFDDGSLVKRDWEQIVSSCFNGPSNLSQAGGMAALTEEGMDEVELLVDYYMANARILKEALLEVDLPYWGGDHAPYLWVDFGKRGSWEVFDQLLEKAHVITSPGIGFGPSGDGFIRLSSFGHKDQVIEAANRITNLFS